MSEITEIYSCKEGQPIKKGALEVSHDVNNKTDAQVNARRKCELNKRIHKVYYYKVGEDGESRIFFTYTNPDADKQVGNDKAAPVKKKKKKKPKPTFMSKLKSAFK